jgi:hypothetical protein
MQQYWVQQEQQSFVWQEDLQRFRQEISALRSLAAVAGVAAHLLEELDTFEHEVEHVASCAWERKEVRVLERNELVRLSLAVLRAYGSRSG